MSSDMRVGSGLTSKDWKVPSRRRIGSLPKVVVGLAAVTLGVWAAVNVAVGAETQSASEIVARCADAMGGMEAIQAVATLRVAAVYPDHGAGPIVSEIKRPNLIRTRWTVFDGHRGALLARTGKDGQPLPPELIPADELKDFEVDVAWVIPAFFEHPADYLGVEAVDGREAHVLRVGLPLGATMTYFVDRDTSLVVKAAADVELRGTKYHMERAFSDHEPAGGVLFPRTFTYPGRHGETQHGSIAAIQVNVALPQDSFRLPAEVVGE